MIRLGILKADDVRPQWLDQYGEYSDQIASLLHRLDTSIRFTVYDVQRGHYPADIDEQQGYLITGSRHSVYEPLPWIARLMEFVRQLDRARKKMVGICFGHQLMAHALGGETRKAEQGWGLGVHSVTFNASVAEVIERGQNLRWLVSHQDQVVRPAAGASVVAGSPFCPNAICQIGQHVLSFQGHPEFVKGYADALMRYRRSDYSDELFNKAQHSLDTPTDELLLARWILDFFSSPSLPGPACEIG